MRPALDVDFGGTTRLAAASTTNLQSGEQSYQVDVGRLWPGEDDRSFEVLVVRGP